MARARFEYTKVILKKVSFNTDLFCKELEKSFKSLLPYERSELLIWLREFMKDKPQLNSCLARISY